MCGGILQHSIRLNMYYVSPNKLYEYVAARLPVATGDFPTLVPIVRGYGMGEVFDETSRRSIADTTRPGAGPTRDSDCVKGLTP